MAQFYEGENPRDNGDLRTRRENFADESARARELARLLIEHVAAAGMAGYELRIDGYTLNVIPAAEDEQGNADSKGWSYRTPNSPLSSQPA